MLCHDSPVLAAKKDEPRPVPWSFKPLIASPAPAVKDAAWPRTQTDRFLLAKMEDAGVRPSRDASPRELIRRLCFDLIGMPPSPDEVAAFEHESHSSSSSHESYAALVEKLLASPHYGERWGRYWLDLARYTDQTPSWLESTASSFLYRDWVVQAFNDDMRYDDFVKRQLAVDQMPGFKPTDLPSLGFLGLSPTYFKELQLPPEIIRTTVADEWEEHVDAIGRTFLGLTLACARCHDHKSDPVSAKDYYALAGVFASVKITERPMMSDDLWRPVAKARAEVTRLEKERDAAKRKPKVDTARIAELEKQVAELKKTPHYNMAMANAVEDAALFVVEADNKKGTKLDYKPAMARDLELMRRGNPNDLGEVVPRGFLAAFGGRKFTSGSGRLELAKAILEDAKPLTARVIVNRIWKHHFGRGLVDTPSEFGNLGDAPTNQPLLDDLAARFIANGWSIKWLHREILHSAVWQQTSLAPESEKRDPENKLFSRMTRRRLDLEAWRDAMLTATGTIDLKVGGPSMLASAPGNHRRTLYATSDRHEMDNFLRLHDFPDPGAHSPWRPETITPLQQLFTLNGPVMLEFADALAKRLDPLPSLTQRVDQTYAWLYQRKPTSKELALAAAFLTGRERDSAAWSQYAQALLGSNELLFVD
ncbi:MAG: DUF1549 and DUF1553 domain-containing protein [Verrucomicrobiaceae bacterium]|nr:DUF1549 and DUF1553 domain-containing protein [Verrucomicrobiaceae bacterium]